MPAAMAGLGQLNSFVGKFVNLWQSGLDASLQFQTSAGKAHVTFKVELGEAPPPPLHHAQPQSFVPGPARLRHRQRRADARLIAAEEAEQQGAAEQADQPGTAEQVGQEDGNPAEEAAQANLETEKVEIDATEKEEIDTTAAAVEVVTEVYSATNGNVVNDEICNDNDYEKKQKRVTENELLEAHVTAGQVEAMSGEVILEVRPQYCDFSSRGLADKLKNMKLDVTCLPWVANTGRLFYTAGFKITEASYEEFKVRNGGNLPNGFYTVQKSRKLN